MTRENGGTSLQLKDSLLWIPMMSSANVENASLASHVAHHLGMSWEEINLRLPLLQPVEMRSEIISDNPEITIIN